MRMGLGIVIAGYLVYLGVDLLKAFARGENGIQPWVAVLFGILFIAAGAIYGGLQILAYRRLKAETESLENQVDQEAEADGGELPEAPASGEEIPQDEADRGEIPQAPADGEEI